MSKKSTQKPFTIETIEEVSGFKTSDGKIHATKSAALGHQNCLNFERLIGGLMQCVDFNEGDYSTPDMVDFLRKNRQEIVRLLYEDASGFHDPFAKSLNDIVVGQLAPSVQDEVRETARKIFEAGFAAARNAVINDDYAMKEYFRIWIEGRNQEKGQ